jgi:hypothetical protein
MRIGFCGTPEEIAANHTNPECRRANDRLDPLAQGVEKSMLTME